MRDFDSGASAQLRIALEGAPRVNSMTHNVSMGYKVRKPDHNGAKNGGGHWGKRAEAKKHSSRVRRQLAKKEAAAELTAAPRV